MITQEATPAMLAQWKAVWLQYKDQLTPNRKTGADLMTYLLGKYQLRECFSANARAVIVGNVLDNEIYAEKLPAGGVPLPCAFLVVNTAAGKALYDRQEDMYRGQPIFVGIDLASGYYHVEGSEALWNELCAYQGLDEKDITNFVRVAWYISCLQQTSQSLDC